MSDSKNDAAKLDETIRHPAATPTHRIDRPDDQRALPTGALSPPYLGTQGDEHRQPSEAERRRLREIQARQRQGASR